MIFFFFNEDNFEKHLDNIKSKMKYDANGIIKIVNNNNNIIANKNKKLLNEMKLSERNNLEMYIFYLQRSFFCCQ